MNETEIRGALTSYAADMRRTWSAAPTNLEQALAPHFKALIETLMPLLVGGSPATLPTLVPEYANPGIGRPDIAFKRPSQPARAFIELKEPRTDIEPARLKGHDKAQFAKFGALPLWAHSNFHRIRLYARENLEAEAFVVPFAALQPETAAAKAAKLIASVDLAALRDLLERLVLAQPVAPKTAQEVAHNLAHAARLVRSIVQEAARALPAASTAPLALVRAEFRDTLYAHPEAGGYTSGDFDTLFGAAFAQVLAFGLLLAREASGTKVGEDAHKRLDEAGQPLLRATLRALLDEDVRTVLGAGFDVMLDTVNVIAPELLAVKGGRDPILYFYEDFLEVFDPDQRRQLGVFYTPVEVVRFQVASVDRALRGIGTNGLLDPNVQILDPACGTGTYLLAVVAFVAERAAAEYGPGGVGPALQKLTKRLHGFELLVGPYAVAQYRLFRELKSHGAAPNERLSVYLADTLAEPGGTSATQFHLGLMSGPIVAERQGADAIKAAAPVLAIIGNPPYRRLQAGETESLVGPFVANLWEAFKDPVRAAGWGNELNTFPDLYIAFWRWCLWKLFERPGADGRGVISLITNRTYLTGHPYAGVRKMLRDRLQRHEIVDLRGDRRGAQPDTAADDEAVFAIMAGTAVLTGIAGGGEPATDYADAWRAGRFTSAAKLGWLAEAARARAPVPGVRLAATGLEDFRPPAFGEAGLVDLKDCFVFRSSGTQTKRDHLVYGASALDVRFRVETLLASRPADAREMFHETRDRKLAGALAVPFEQKWVEPTMYRPFDARHLYAHRAYCDYLRTELREVWGDANLCLYAMPSGTAAGPAAWAHALKPDYHAFSGRGGYAFPLYDRRPLAPDSNLNPRLLAGLAAAHGGPPEPQTVFDAMLALLSASSYAHRFAEDLQDAFPHIPFPRAAATFHAAATLGARIRTLETFARAPEVTFRAARLLTRPDAVTLGAIRPGSFMQTGDGQGWIALCTDGSGRVGGIAQTAWDFQVSGYRVLQKWLAHREGQAIDDALIRDVLDIAARLAELRTLMDEADPILEAALADPLPRDALVGTEGT